LLVNDLDFASGDIPLVQIESILTLFKTNLNTQKETNEKFLEENKPKPKVAEFVPLVAAALAPMIIPGIISAFADIAGYFQVNYDIKGQEFTLDNQAIIAIVAGKINVPVYIFNFNLIKESDVLNSFNNTLGLRQKLDATIDRIKSEIVKMKKDEIKKIESKIQGLKATSGTLKDTEEDRKKKEKNRVQLENSLAQANELVDLANTLIVNSESLSKAFSIFADSATKATDEKTPPLLLKAALRKYIRASNITHLLNLKIVSSGGEAITMKRRLMFWKNNASFIGGSVISYVLAETSGRVVAADTVPGLAQLNYRLSGEGESVFKEISLPEHEPKEKEKGQANPGHNKPIEKEPAQPT
jgi:hypothetical protein